MMKSTKSATNYRILSNLNDTISDMFRKLWWLKLTLKVTLRLMPIDYASWRKLNLFAHGNMQNFDFSKRFFTEFFLSSGKNNIQDIVEIGPGDSLNSALFAHAHGLNSSTLVDLGWQAHSNLSLYNQVALELQDLDLPNNFALPFSSIQEMLKDINSTYLLNGINSLSFVESRSVDVIASNAVLEHLDVVSVKNLMVETSRILRSDGVAIHRIDFRDHIFNDFNHLGFSNRFSNSFIVRNSGNYLNRLHLLEYLKFAEEADLAWELRREVTRSKSNRVKISKDVSNHWKEYGSLVESVDLVLKIPKK